MNKVLVFVNPVKLHKTSYHIIKTVHAQLYNLSTSIAQSQTMKSGVFQTEASLPGLSRDGLITKS